MRRIAINSIALSLGSYFAQGASVITYLLAARALGPAIFGPFSGAIGLAFIVVTFGDFGINGWAIRELARDPSAARLFTRTLTAKLTIATFLALLWLAVSAIAFGGSPLIVPIALLGLYVLTLVVTGTLLVPFRAHERLTLVSLINGLEKAVGLGVWLALHLLLRTRAEIALALALIIGATCSMVCAWFLVPSRLRALSAPSLQEIMELWRLSLSFGVASVATQIFRADAAIVGIVAGPYAAGVYAAPARFTSFLTIIPTSFSAAIYPRLARSQLKSPSRRPELLGAVAMLMIMALMVGALAVSAPFLVPFFLGPEYLSSVGVFRLFLLVVLINAANQPLLTLLQADGHDRYVARAMVTTAVAGFVVVAAGARYNGATGAAAGALVLQVLQLLVFLGRSVSSRERSMGTPSRGAELRQGPIEMPSPPPTDRP